MTRREVLILAQAGMSMPLIASAQAQNMTDTTIWPRQNDVKVGGGTMHYADRGLGKPLVLLPKLGGWIADWDAIVPLIDAGHRVIAIDPPGHGLSHMGGPAPDIMTMPECAALILAVLDALEIEQCDFMGNSMGGVIALLIAATYPERVRKLALISTAMSEPLPLAKIREIDAERKAAATPLIRSAAEQTARFGTIDPRISQQQAASNARAGAWKEACERGVGLLGIARYLPRVKAPTMVISADRGAYLRYNAVARATLRDVRIETVSETGSFVHQEKPQAVADLINPFFAR